MQIARHRCHAVDHALVHANVDHVRAVLHLLPCDCYSFFVFSFLDQLRKLGRPSHIGSLTDQDEDAWLLREWL